MSDEKVLKRFEDLPTRAVTHIMAKGITTKTQLRKAVKEKTFHPDAIKHYGWSTHSQVLQWLGMRAPQ